MTTSTKLLQFLPKQRLFMESTHDELMYSGAFGAGKSRIGCEKGHFLSEKYPGNTGAIIRKTFSHLRITTMETYFNDVLPPSHQEHFDKDTWTLTLKNKSRIRFLGLDQKFGESSKVGSLEVGWIFVDEAVEIEESDWDMLQGRLRLNTVPFYQIFGATNPGPPSHWIYRRFFLDNDPDRLKLESNTLENTFLPQAYRDRLNKFTGTYRQRYVEGKWVGFEGLVYKNFDPLINIIDPFEVPEFWPVYRAIDFGYTNPFVCQWWTTPPEQSGERPPGPPAVRPWYLIKEIYMSQRTIPQLAPQIHRESEGYRIALTISDWDAGDRAILENEGIPTIKARKEIEPGIQETYETIDQNRVFIFRDSLVELDTELRRANKPTSTIEEFPAYRYNPSNLSRNPRNPKEIPLDRDNHGMDAMRYLIWTLGGSNPNQGVTAGRSQSQWGTAGRFRPLAETRPSWRALS